jgi:D-serine deaminase-like pyridoxal phosphate-dependent protein
VEGGVGRRTFLAAGAAAVAGSVALPVAAVATGKERLASEPLPEPAIGAGGQPMSLSELAQLAREIGHGQPVALLDLAAVDQNVKVVVDFARGQGWAVRPAMKTFRSPGLISYVLERMPQPRALIFNLAEVDSIVATAPPNPDLMTGYPPTFGQLEAFLGRPAPSGQRPHTVRILIDSVPLMVRLAELVQTTPRQLPIDVALELDVGMGRGGFNDGRELQAAIDVFRTVGDRLRLGAVVGYDGHATLTGTGPYRKLVATQAMRAYRQLLQELRKRAGDLYDEEALIRNGPASSNYRNWRGGPANEISCGSAFLRAGYLDGGYDVRGLTHALTLAGAVIRITSDSPSVPVTQSTLPGSTKEEIIVQSVGTPEEMVYPPKAQTDELSGAGNAMVVPKGSVKLGDYVLYRPTQTEDGITRFQSLVAVREGQVLRVWPTFPQPPYLDPPA